MLKKSRKTTPNSVHSGARTGTFAVVKRGDGPFQEAASSLGASALASTGTGASTTESDSSFLKAFFGALKARFDGLNLSRVLVADLQMIGASIFFGIGFIGQRKVSTHGLGVMTCNAIRFGFGTLLLVAVIPFLPKEVVDDKVHGPNQYQSISMDSPSSKRSPDKRILNPNAADLESNSPSISNGNSNSNNISMSMSRERRGSDEEDEEGEADLYFCICDENGVGCEIHPPDVCSYLEGNTSLSLISSSSAALVSTDSIKDKKENQKSIEIHSNHIHNNIKNGKTDTNSPFNNDNDNNNNNNNANDWKKKYTGVYTQKNNAIISLYGLRGYIARTFLDLRRDVHFWGILLGCINFAASGFQQWGIHYTSAAKVAFISGFDLFLIPLLGLIIPSAKPHSHVSPRTWLAVAISFVGIYFLSGVELGYGVEVAGAGEAAFSLYSLGPGERMTVVSAVFWSLHITYTDKGTTYVDCVSMMCIQLGVVCLLSAIYSLCMEMHKLHLLWEHIWLFFPWLVYLGACEAIALTLMALGQSNSPPTHAAIILSLEGVFAALAEVLVLGEALTSREMIGCVAMLAGTYVAESGAVLARTNTTSTSSAHASTENTHNDNMMNYDNDNDDDNTAIEIERRNRERDLDRLYADISIDIGTNSNNSNNSNNNSNGYGLGSHHRTTTNTSAITSTNNHNHNHNHHGSRAKSRSRGESREFVTVKSKSKSETLNVFSSDSDGGYNDETL